MAIANPAGIGSDRLLFGALATLIVAAATGAAFLAYRHPPIFRRVAKAAFFFVGSTFALLAAALVGAHLALNFSDDKLVALSPAAKAIMDRDEANVQVLLKAILVFLVFFFYMYFLLEVVCPIKERAAKGRAKLR